MAANKFATMLHRNTHKFTVILVYAVLEWILILLLLLNSLFSYLISNFAKYFGLKKPCLWCSRLDHILEPNGNKKYYSDLLCEEHTTEISKLSYCPNHQKLADSNKMCSNCCPSQPAHNGSKVIGISQIAFFTWVSKNVDENFEKDYRCSCCDVSLTSKLYPSLRLLKPSWRVLDYSQKESLASEPAEEDNGSENSDTNASKSDGLADHDNSGLNIELKIEDEAQGDEDQIVSDVDKLNFRVAGEEDYSMLLKNSPCDTKKGIECGFVHSDSESLGILESREIESSSIQMDELLIQGLSTNTGCKFVATQAAKFGDKELEAVTVEEADNFPEDEIKSNTVIGIEVPGYEPADHSHAKEPTFPSPSGQTDQSFVDTENISSATGLDAFEESKEADEEKFLQEPTHMDNPHQLHKKMLLVDKMESGAEDSWDGSVISEIEGDDGLNPVEKLKSALKAQRKALNALYAELEEERSASAIAANQTMAMITRLQEEKAAMQMEALQYQRMMEEQSEYDQEALQLLNELMVKRDKEKQELEVELEMYRKKVLDYEAKECLTMLRKQNHNSVSIGHSLSSSSDGDDKDELSIDLNHEWREGDTSIYNREETSNSNPTGEVIDLGEVGIECIKHLNTLDESLAEFEEERQSIMEELKALEEKLFTLADVEDEQLFENIRQTEHFGDDYVEKLEENYGSRNEEEKGASHGLSEDLKNPLENRFELEDKKVAIEEEVDRVYERLQALEADGEFLKDCKGMDLLQEVMQHLGDLRSVEMRLKNMDVGSLAQLSA